jgi:hypothetical protein
MSDSCAYANMAVLVIALIYGLHLLSKGGQKKSDEKDDSQDWSKINKEL